MVTKQVWQVVWRVGSNESCQAEIGAWEEAVEKLGNLTAAATTFIESPSDLELASGYGLDPGFWSTDACKPQILLLPFGDKDNVDWLVHNGEDFEKLELIIYVGLSLLSESSMFLSSCWISLWKFFNRSCKWSLLIRLALIILLI